MTTTGNTLRPGRSSTVSTTEKVAETIREGIRIGRFVPGQHLVEADLTQQLQISRSSLREALHHLNGDGIVAMHRHRGTHICRLTRKAVDDLLEVLEQLVRLAARKAAHSALEKRIVMDAAIEASERHRIQSDQRAYQIVRQSFYDALFTLSGNDELPRVIPLRRADLFRAQIRPYQTIDQQHVHANGYRTIAEAVLGGDGMFAEAAVQRHFEATRAMVDTMPPDVFEAE